MFKTFKKKKMKKKRGFVKRVQPVTGSHSLRGGAHLGPAGQQAPPGQVGASSICRSQRGWEVPFGCTEYRLGSGPTAFLDVSCLEPLSTLRAGRGGMGSDKFSTTAQPHGVRDS